MRNFFIYGGGIFSLGNLLYFAWSIWCGAVSPTNTASWMMWLLLDVTILGATIADKKPVALPLSYVLGALAVFLVHIKMGTWHWTYIETFSALGVAVSVILWMKLSPGCGIVACVSAMTIAGIPLAVTLWNDPDPRAFWVFANTAIACIATLAGTKPWTPGGVVLAGGGLLYNGSIACIAILR